MLGSAIVASLPQEPLVVLRRAGPIAGHLFPYLFPLRE
jgi:hypothetical protein